MKPEAQISEIKQRKPYVKPQIEKVHLKTNETMGNACYSLSNSSSMGYTDCHMPHGCLNVLS
jgi:hypothetical protein